MTGLRAGPGRRCRGSPRAGTSATTASIRARAHADAPGAVFHVTALDPPAPSVAAVRAQVAAAANPTTAWWNSPT